MTFIVSLLFGCTMHNNKPIQGKNRLANETSPYLLQHADNPVNWYPWGKEALEKAIQEDKMLLISIGYSACHWCHVMEHQSFEDSTVASLMNEHFVCVKVDREERPDVDQVYMNAVQLLTKSGGWPLNCFALPDGSPVYGGTYFPKENWMQLLNYMAEIYENDKEKAVQQAAQLKQGVSLSEFIGEKSNEQVFSADDLDDAYKPLEKSFDTKLGGFVGAPKFPMPTSWTFVLRYGASTNNNRAQEQVLFTLDKIANGGIYDHVGGGFSRYSIDEEWFAPHFEKMLYDNAQLISLYSEAYQISKKENFRNVVYETFRFAERELSSPEGAFFSALDADSEGEEGKYYVWTKPELEKLLGENSSLVCEYYGVKETGNWEKGNNILAVSLGLNEMMENFSLSRSELDQIISESKEILLKAREKRISPGLDDKILTSWNALMIKGLVDAYKAFSDEVFLQRAVRAAEFIIKKQTQPDNSLYRSFKNGQSTISAFLGDYAAVIDAFISLYSCTFEEKWLLQAKSYTEYILSNFFNPESSMFYYTNKNYQELVVRKMEITDNVIPASNSMMAHNLLTLASYLDNEDYLNISHQMLFNTSDEIRQYGRYYTNWASLMLKNVFQKQELVIVGDDAANLRANLNDYYLPNVLVAGSLKQSNLPLVNGRYVEGKTLIYVCKDKACKMPVETIEEAIDLIKQNNNQD